MPAQPQNVDSGTPCAVLDAMIWARGLIARNPTAAPAVLVKSWKDGRFRIAVSGELVEEIAGTLLELGADREDVVSVIELLATETQVVAIQHQRMGCDDLEDDHLLETAVTGMADYLVSEDRAVYDLPSHVREYLSRQGVLVRRAHEFCEDLERFAAGATTPARRLALLGGTEPDLIAPTRRRSDPVSEPSESKNLD